jgi:hypothetical protein
MGGGGGGVASLEALEGEGGTVGEKTYHRPCHHRSRPHLREKRNRQKRSKGRSGGQQPHVKSSE